MTLNELIIKYSSMLPNGFIQELQDTLNKHLVTVFGEGQIDLLEYQAMKPDSQKIVKQEMHKAIKETVVDGLFKEHVQFEESLSMKNQMKYFRMSITLFKEVPRND